MLSQTPGNPRRLYTSFIIPSSSDVEDIRMWTGASSCVTTRQKSRAIVRNDCAVKIRPATLWIVRNEQPSPRQYSVPNVLISIGQNFCRWTSSLLLPVNFVLWKSGLVSSLLTMTFYICFDVLRHPHASDWGNSYLSDDRSRICTSDNVFWAVFPSRHRLVCVWARPLHYRIPLKRKLLNIFSSLILGTIYLSAETIFSLYTTQILLWNPFWNFPFPTIEFWIPFWFTIWFWSGRNFFLNGQNCGFDSKTISGICHDLV